MKFSRRLADCDAKGKVFALEGKTGYSFINATPEECWLLMQRHKHVHECIRVNQPCHLFFDIDGTVKDVRDTVTWLKKHLLYICNTRYGHTDIVTLTANGRKGSAHLIVKPHVFSNTNQCQLFVSRLQVYLESTNEFDERLWSTIDLSVYRPNKLFRMLGMTKRGEERPFVGKPFEREHWISTLVQPLEYSEVIDLGAKKSTMKGTPPEAFSEVKRWLESKGEIMSVWSPPIANWTVCVSFRRFKCPYKGGYHASNHNYIVVNMLKQRYQIRCQDADCKGKWENWKRIPPGLFKARIKYREAMDKRYTI